MPYFKRLPEDDPSQGPQLAGRTTPAAMLQPIELVELATELLRTEASGTPGGADARSAAVDVTGQSTAAVLAFDTQTTRAGSLVRRRFTLANDDLKEVETSFVATDLTTVEGYRLPASLVSCVPAQARVASGETQTIDTTICLPSSARPGFYIGLLRATSLPHVYAVLELELIGPN